MRYILKQKIKFISLLLFFCTCFTIIANTSSNLKISFYIDWLKSNILFSIVVGVDKNGLPASKQEAEGIINRSKIDLIRSSLMQITLDSWGSFYDVRDIDVGYKWDLDNICKRAVKKYSVFSDDMKSVRVVYQISFKDIWKNIHVNYSSMLEPNLIPSNQVFDYTGIVIIASNELIYKKTDEKRLLLPALLPSVYSQDGRLLLSATTLTNQVLSDKGVVSYSYSTKMEDWDKTRVGSNPFIISAKEILNNSFADVVISNYDADTLLASDRAINLLKEAKVVVIIKEPEQISNLETEIETERNEATKNSLSRF